MLKNTIFNSYKHSNYKLKYFLVVYLDDRITKSLNIIEEELKVFIYNNFKDYYKCQVYNVIISHDGEVKIEFEAVPTVQLSKVVNSFKTATSKLIRNKYKEGLDQMAKGLWKSNYYIYTVGV